MELLIFYLVYRWSIIKKSINNKIIGFLIKDLDIICILIFNKNKKIMKIKILF